ncbi:hypothetical protein [Aliivibrio sp. S2MY1]|uniref:hypothetical protein n=1 Tax=Aliivibrio sp. S2MY1 TaxID=3028423 RepID=UPI002379101A|nr:hypothetical protein [Aliivibrio sp. S2MY1]MDD9199162.1 hypothetical protein [Aliivibrio sp. S2MY1]
MHSSSLSSFSTYPYHHHVSAIWDQIAGFGKGSTDLVNNAAVNHYVIYFIPLQVNGRQKNRLI